MSLSPETIKIVKSCVPVLEENGEALTRLFYSRMFDNNPEVQPFFNPAHQRAGSQQRALAGAILAYARHIDNPGALADAVSLIAHKHVSLMVQPEHYPIVGENLLAALADLLGDAATPELLSAWEEAYGFLADVLINAERELYVSQQSSHWNGFRDFEVAEVVDESEEIRSIYLEPVDGEAEVTHQPGQYLTVRMSHPDTGTTMRNYSISSAPGSKVRISVKQETGDVDGWVSNQLHQVSVGDQIEVGPPCGDFILENADASHPLVFIAGGVGVTPLLSMFHAAAASEVDRDIHFIHAARSRGVRAFEEELKSLAGQHERAAVHVCLEDVTDADVVGEHYDTRGRVTSQLLADLTTSDAEVYFCGPPAFMTDISAALDAVGIPAERRHHEFFGPAQALG